MNRSGERVPFADPAVIAGCKLVVLDCETTGFHASARVVELGLVFLDDEGESRHEWSSLFRGDRWIDDDVTAVNGITTTMLQSAPRFKESLESLERALCGLPVVAHNAPFDHGKISHEFSRVRREPPPPFICSMALMSRLGYGKLSLASATDLLGIETHPDHSALTDALATVEVLRALKKKHPHDFDLW